LTGHLINTPAVLAKCSRCGAATITGTTSGLTTVADVHPLTIPEEITAIMSGKATFTLTAAGRNLFLTWRSVAEISAVRDHPVVAVHECPAGTHQQPVTVPASSLPDDPPF
jgi:hypothetical protein